MQKLAHRIIVLGPLRSGTSLTAELVHLWGAHAGRKDELWQSDPNDQRGYGYMEYIPLQQLNDDLLNGNDRVPPPIELMAEKASNPKYKDQALHLLHVMDEKAAKNGASAWVWKDARLPLTLPFWMNFWGDAVFIITVRHPAETILSAAKTEGFEEENLPFSAGLIYWQYCMLNILSFAQSSRRKIFISYDQLTSNPRQECTRLSRFLDEQCERPQEDAQQRLETMLSQISENQRHYRYEKSLAEMGSATREQRALYDFLRVKTLYPDEAFNKDDFSLYPGWREYLQTMDMLLSLTGTQEA
jgi:hypothetical protein